MGRNVVVYRHFQMRFAVLVAALLLHFQAVLPGAPHLGDEFKLKQPDDSYVSVRVWGDEFYQRVEGLDGYTLVRNPKTRWICYARLSSDESELVPTDIVYRDRAIAQKALGVAKGIDLSPQIRRAKSLQKRLKLLGEDEGTDAKLEDAPVSKELTGSVLGLTLLIDFPDDPCTIPRSEVENYLNQYGYSNYGNNGSIRDYFQDISGGLLDYTNYVTEYYTALHNKDYYTDESIPYGNRARGLIHEALAWLDGQGFDFSILSTDSDGQIRAINALYAGYRDNAWAEGLWPHKGHLEPTFYADGVKSGDYQITNIGNELYLGTFCHENGHLLFDWLDLYDYDLDSYGIGFYGLMGYGGHGMNPMPPNPSYRIQAGWESSTELTDILPGTVVSHTANSRHSYRYSHPSWPEEYFLIESRFKAGRSATIHDEGLLIWHIDESQDNNNDQQMTYFQHYRVSVEQADGLFELETNDDPGSEGDLFHAGYADIFRYSTVPDANWWDGEDSGLFIHSISEVGTQMSFMFGAIRGDFEPDGDVDFDDLRTFAQRWNDRCRPRQWCDGCDLNRDQWINFADFAMLAQNWLKQGQYE